MRRKLLKSGWHTIFSIAVCSVAIGINAESTLESVSWISTTEQNRWVDKETLDLSEWDDDTTRYIEIDEETKYQVIDGWGGAINEHGWHAMKVLSDAKRDEVMKAIFDTAACAMNIGRISMGANDYSLSLYSCDDTPDDYTMSNFSLEKDRVNVIPFALAAKAINPAMLFWGSPHSPPAWMKQNNNMIDGSLKTDDATRKAYALYFQKWIENMELEGIHIYAVHIQNEPNITGNGYPACEMSGAEMGILIKDYIGPQLRTNGLATEIWAGTLHSTNPGFTSFYPEYIPPTLGDPDANPYISGVGMQWNALQFTAEVVTNYPEVKMMQTETQCGNFYWQPEYNAEAAPNDWAYGVFTFHRMLQWFRAGINSYCQWNIVLDEKGISNSITNPWPQNSMISVDQTTKEVRYNPQFYAAQHFSHFVKPGAHRIATGGNYNVGGMYLLSENIGEGVTDGDMMAFRNPNGDKILVARNSSPTDITVAVKIGSMKFKPTIPANSLNTFLISDPVAVRRDAVSVVKKQTVSVRSVGATVRFSIPAASGTTVTCVILDAFGRTMKKLERSAVNNHTAMIWDRTNEHGGNVAPGVYVARINSGDTPSVHAFALQ
ncbi:MAG: glycoside hydrolase family 30 protein [Chitinispirillaceae bacterium]|nr:glycoside hydrolase family 30 protein [Chitinispirillaceae bacterium]